MRLRAPLIAVIVLLSVSRPSRAEVGPGADQWSVGSSAWMFANLLPDAPQFYYLEVNRRFGERHALEIEPVTWTYHAPIGIPYGSSYGDRGQDYPGFVRSIGIGVGWRCYLYRGLNASLRAFNFLQVYSENDRPRKTGYQLFLQTRAGWRWAARAPGVWIEPAIAFNWWPIEAGRPASFRARDDRWPSYFLLEPWLNAGWRW